MSEEGSNQQTNQFPHSLNTPLSKALSVPVFSSHAGQLMPLGFMPVNCNNLPYVNELSKNQGQSFPALPLLGDHNLNNKYERGTSSSVAKSFPMIPKTSDSATLPGKELPHGQFCSAMLPLMPSVVFLPFIPGFFPGASPHPTNDRQTKKEEDAKAKSHCDGVNDAVVDELDVAQILVDMQGPSSNPIKNNQSPDGHDNHKNNAVTQMESFNKTELENNSNMKLVSNHKESSKEYYEELDVTEETNMAMNSGSQESQTLSLKIKLESNECDETPTSEAIHLQPATSPHNTEFFCSEEDDIELQETVVEIPCHNTQSGVFSPKIKLVDVPNEPCSADLVGKQEIMDQHISAEPLKEEEPIGDDKTVLKKVFKCDVCSQLFRSLLGLQKHIEFHTQDSHKLYSCNICVTNFHDKVSLQSHISTHTKKRPHKCTFCPKAFRDPGSLQKHVRVHTGEKPYKCKDCSRSFAEYSSLRKHQRVHTGEQPYKCQYCSKAFSISGNLQRHILIHTGERPYKCNFCQKAFNNPSHLRRHVKNIHFKGDSVVDEAMLSHYGNTVSKSCEEVSKEFTIETKLETSLRPENINSS